MMRRVIIESPYAGDVERNTLYAQRAMRDSLLRGESPLASHLLYTQLLDDMDEKQRAAGMEAGWAWLDSAHAVVLYTDYGISPGMDLGAARAIGFGIRVEQRRIGVNQ